MKKIIAAVLACCALSALIGCEKLPEEPEPTNTPSANTPEPRDYYSDSSEASQEPDEDESAEGGGEEDTETEEESEEGEEEESPSSSSDSDSSGTRRPSADIEAELHPNVVVNSSGGTVGSDLGRGYRMILPPLRAYSMSGGGVARATASPEPEPEPEPEPTPEPQERELYVINEEIPTGPLESKAFIYNGSSMVPLEEIINVIGIMPSIGDNIEIDFDIKGVYIHINLISGDINIDTIPSFITPVPIYKDDKWFVPAELFKRIGAVIKYDGSKFDITF